MRKMADYISKQAVIDYLNGYLHSLGEGGADTLLFDRGQRRALINSLQDISAVKAADVQPVKHGRWEQIGEQNAKCTACSGVLRSNGIDRTGKALIFNAIYHYCPFCGARMDLGDEKHE